MRKKLVATLIALGAVVASFLGAAPAGATKEKPVEVRQECGTYNVYVNGTPVITHVWCPENPPA